MAVISEFTAAVNQICSERGIDPEEVFTALEEAVLTAYQKEFGEAENLSCEIERETGGVHMIASKEIVEKAEDDLTQISLDEAKKLGDDLKIGDHLEMEVPTEDLGRIAAQTAKQVILQKMREAERSAVLEEFSQKIGTVVTGMVQRMMGPIAVVEIGKATAKMPPEEQIPNEFYKIGERYKFLVKEIREEDDELIVSRKDPAFLIELFKLEVPEIESEIVEIKAVAREAGSRSKLAVISNQDGIDPIGSCVGQRGVRIANVMSELGEEKIDIIEWAEEEDEFVAKALGPAEVNSVKIDGDVASVEVSDEQLSLAIGKEGQNVRLAAKLTNKKIDIMSPGLKENAGASPVISSRVLTALEKSGVSLEDVLKMKDKEVLDLKGVGKTALEEIRQYQEVLEDAGKKDDESKETEEVSEDEDSGSEIQNVQDGEKSEDDDKDEDKDENEDEKEPSAPEASTSQGEDDEEDSDDKDEDKEDSDDKDEDKEPSAPEASTSQGEDDDDDEKEDEDNSDKKDKE